jgi:hypothetical protein
VTFHVRALMQMLPCNFLLEKNKEVALDFKGANEMERGLDVGSTSATSLHKKCPSTITSYVLI